MAFVQANGGQFILRIEDTDQSRYVEGSVENIYEGLRWLGSSGTRAPTSAVRMAPTSSRSASRSTRLSRTSCAPVIAPTAASVPRNGSRNSGRTSRKDGLAPGYDGRCRATPGDEADERVRSEPSVVRFRMDRTGVTTLDDAIRGDVTFQNALQDDFVIVKTDGFPTYHLAMLVDDHDMEITHVIRGEEWLASAPKHLQLYEAMGWPAPHFAHLPCSSTRAGRSSRSAPAMSLPLPIATVATFPERFSTSSPSSAGRSTTRQRMSRARSSFTPSHLDRVVPNPAFFDTERLDSLNGHYIRSLTPEAWRELVAEWLDRDLSADVPRPLDSELVAALAPLLRSASRASMRWPGLRASCSGSAPTIPPTS